MAYVKQLQELVKNIPFCLLTIFVGVLNQENYALKIQMTQWKSASSTF